MGLCHLYYALLDLCLISLQQQKRGTPSKTPRWSFLYSWFCRHGFHFSLSLWNLPEASYEPCKLHFTIFTGATIVAIKYHNQLSSQNLSLLHLSTLDMSSGLQCGQGQELSLRKEKPQCFSNVVMWGWGATNLHFLEISKHMASGRRLLLGDKWVRNVQTHERDQPHRFKQLSKPRMVVQRQTHTDSWTL